MPAPKRLSTGPAAWLAALALTLASLILAPATAHAGGTWYYVDCSAATNGNGSYGAPWNSLAAVSTGPGGGAFQPGDGIWLKRGTTCSGSVNPPGSGSSASAPIYLGSYGSGANAVIDAAGQSYGVRLYNQQYWQIENLEVKGSSDYGIFISGNTAGHLTWFRVVNTTIHDVGIGSSAQGEKGLLLIMPDAATTTPTTFLDDILVDHVTAYNTPHWQGIRIGRCGRSPNISCGQNDNRAGVPRASTAVVQNSVVHDTGGDGILVMQTNSSTVQNNVVHDTGKATGPNGEWTWTPNGIWTWNCDGCVVQGNEVYNASSYGIDGGGVDIDTLSSNTTVQNNYIHDNQGYCVSVLGAYGVATTNSVVRDNICANNSRRADNDGDIFLFTWSGGTLNGVTVSNNTISWNPGGAHSALDNQAAFSGTGTNVFANNLVQARAGQMLYTDNTNVSSDHNLWWWTGTGSPTWTWNNVSYSSLAALQSATGQESGSVFADPGLVSPTYHAVGAPTTAYTFGSTSPAVDAGRTVSGSQPRDFYGNTAPRGNAPDVGSYESPYSH